MITSIKTSAYNAFNTVAAKIQATSLWQQLPSKSAVTAVASNVVFSKYTHAVIGVGIFCAAAKRAYSNYQNYMKNPTKAIELETVMLDANNEAILDDQNNFVTNKELITEFNHTLKGKVSAVILPGLIATAALSATIARVILLP